MAFFTAPRVFAVLVLTTAALPVAANAADSAYDQRVAVVSTSGLDLSTPVAQAQLRHRVAVAAYKVCDQLTQGDAMTSPGFAECISRATADARSQMDRQIASANTRAMVASIASK